MGTSSVVRLGAGGSVEAGEGQESFAVFCGSELPRLEGFLTLLSGSADVGADLAQEAMARAWERWDRLASHPDLGGWVHRVGINLVRSRARRDRLWERVAGRFRQRPQQPVENDPDPDLQAALRALSQRQREAVVHRFYLDLSVDQTAAAMGCAPGTVRALTSQAMGRLRAILDSEE